MKKILLTGTLLSALFGSTYAQTLFTFGDNPVTSEEFLRVYRKNNASKADYSEAALREYIDLYSLFRMKVKEAELQHMDTSASVSAEITNYRKQLARGYLTDELMVNRLIQEAYERTKEELHVAHILFAAGPGIDTAVLRKRMDSVYTQISSGKADFAAVAKAMSDDRGSKANGGDIGYFTGLQTVYAFETVAYNTPAGKVSAPFKTSFGYHLLKVLDRRQARGTAKLAQILISVPKSAGDSGMLAAQKKADMILKEIKKGTSFTDLVERYSDDKFSKDKGGELPIYGAGNTVPALDEAIFALKKPGDVTPPLKTEFGIHIIKLIERYPPKPFDSVKKELKAKVENDSRAQQARESYFAKVREANGFKTNPGNFEVIKSQLGSIADTGKDAGVFTRANFPKGGKNVLFTLAGNNYTQDDFITYAVGVTRGKIAPGDQKPVVFQELYNMYEVQVVTDFQEKKLVETNPDFKSLMQEYRDGIMLFELMDRNVWGKAAKDTVGLKMFHETQKDKYVWQPGFKGAVYTFRDEAAMKQGLKLLAKKDMGNEELTKTMNTAASPDAVSIQTGRFEFAKYPDIPAGKLVAGKISEPIEKNGAYLVVKSDEVYSQPVVKTFAEARGYVVSTYQDKLEKDWNAQLRSKYPVKVNDAELKKITK
jgi:peptidyl-prolyl cis-trans isomerase SurA